MKWCLACVLFVTACGDDLTTLDATVPQDQGGVGDLGAQADGGGALGGAFTISGCASLDQTTNVPRCHGVAPLTVTFVPVVAGVDNFVWSFPGGDPASSRDVNPVITFGKPSTYAVSLAAGGAAGTLTANGQVIVSAGDVGEPCVDSSDCDVGSGLFCLCGGGVCPGALAAGYCTRPCGPSPCGAGEQCIDLTRGAPPAPPSGVDGGDPDGGAAGDPWRGAFCMKSCAVATDCRPGLACRELPALKAGQSAGGGFAWQSACFADLLGDDGASCADPDGQPAADRCLSGRCDALGARDLCTSACSALEACPSADSCATFNGGGATTCLVRCDMQHPCSDPLLTCQLPGQPGALGFTVAPGDPAGTTYCAPKSCTQPSDCTPAGVCTTLAGGQFCTRS